MRGTQNLLWILLGCTLGATSAHGQSEASSVNQLERSPTCPTYRGLMAIPAVSDYIPAEGKGRNSGRALSRVVAALLPCAAIPNG